MTDQEFFSPKEVAAMLGVHRRTLARLSVRGDGPKFIKVNDRVLKYPRKALIEWIESKRVGGIDTEPDGMAEEPCVKHSAMTQRELWATLTDDQRIKYLASGEIVLAQDEAREILRRVELARDTIVAFLNQMNATIETARREVEG